MFNVYYYMVKISVVKLFDWLFCLYWLLLHDFAIGNFRLIFPIHIFIQLFYIGFFVPLNYIDHFAPLLFLNHPQINTLTFHFLPQMTLTVLLKEQRQGKQPTSPPINTHLTSIKFHRIYPILFGLL